MKDALRARMRAQLRQYASAPRTKADPGLLPAELLSYAQTVLTFLSTPLERSTDQALTQALQAGKQVAAPRVTAPGEMAFYRLSSAAGPFARGYAGIREPIATSQDDSLWPRNGASGLTLPLLVLVPGLAFTREGLRLGTGGGYYDRFLSALLKLYAPRRAEILLAGWCHPFQIIETIPVTETDVPVDCLLTAEECIFIKTDGGSQWER